MTASDPQASIGNRTPQGGLLIINADDWGRDAETTDWTLECISQRAVSSVSAMVFMEDSERASDIARGRGIDAGLHLNFTTAFSGTAVSSALTGHWRHVATFLRSFRMAQVVFHPGLARSFEYLIAAQVDEYARLYGTVPRRLDGHHHMHLSANAIGLLPAGTVVRRNFTFRAGEKNLANRLYRTTVDRRLARRHTLTDFLFSLLPIEPSRIQRIDLSALRHTVELETHPVNAEERAFLTRQVPRWAAEGVPVASRFGVAESTKSA